MHGRPLILSAALRALRFAGFFFLLPISFAIIRNLLDGGPAAHSMSYWLAILRISAELGAFVGGVSFIYFRWLEPNAKR